VIVGYARTSTADQEAGFAAQRRDLEAAGCERLFSEQVSSMGGRAQLEAALDFVREDDVFVVTKLDRLARSVRNLMEVMDRLKAKNVELRILDMGLDTSTPTGKLILGVMAHVAQFERDMMLERQREGIARAKADGKFKGRKPTARAKAAAIRRLRAEGVMPTAIAAKLNIGRTSVYRVLDAGFDAPHRGTNLTNT
jgi:DNA invertase Pin-like site-specific DNA recombinase